MTPPSEDVLAGADDEFRSVPEMEAEISQLSRQVSKYRRAAKEYRRRLESVCADLQSSLAEVHALTLERDRLEAQLQTTEHDNEVLQLQLEAAHASHIESESAWTSAHANAKQLATTIDSLSTQAEHQHTEIAGYCAERGALLVLVHKLHSALCQSESTLCDALAENQRLKQRREAIRFPVPEALTIPNPFKGELGVAVAEIVSATNSSASNKIHLVLQEVATAIDEAERQSSERTAVLEKALQNAEEKHDKTKQTAAVIVANLRQLALHEAQIDRKLFCSADEAFRQLMAMRAFECSCFDDSIDSRFLPFHLFGDENRSHRLEIVRQIENTSREASAFLAALFTVNFHALKQIKVLLDAAADKVAIDSALAVLGLTDPQEIPATIEAIQSRFAALRADRKQLRQLVREQQRDVTDERSMQEMLSHKLTESEKQISSLHATVQRLTAQVSELEAASQVPREKDCSVALDSQISELKRALQEKESALTRARARQSESELMVSGEVERLTLLNASLTKKLELLCEAYSKLKRKEGKSRNSRDRALSHAKRDYHSALQTSQEEFESERKLLVDTNAELQRQITDLKNLGRNLTNSLEESEKRNQFLQDQLSRLTVRNSTLQKQIVIAEERFEQVKQSLQAQATARSLSLETRLVQAQNEERSKLMAETQSLLGLVADELGPLYGMSGLDLDRKSCLQLLQTVAADLKRARRL
jgi:chromosome segregation ATPase